MIDVLSKISDYKDERGWTECFCATGNFNGISQHTKKASDTRMP